MEAQKIQWKATVNVLNFQTLSCLLKRPRQTEQTQIRLLLPQSDQGLPYLQLLIPAFIFYLEQNVKHV